MKPKSNYGIIKRTKTEWEQWLSEIPENVKKVASKIVPWKEYIQKGVDDDLGNRYKVISYNIEKNKSVTLKCEKINYQHISMGGCIVFGMNPEDFTEAEPITVETDIHKDFIIKRIIN